MPAKPDGVSGLRLKSALSIRGMNLTVDGVDEEDIRDAVSPTPVRDRRQPGAGSTSMAISGGTLSTAAKAPQE
jgi:hypothetical protein